MNEVLFKTEIDHEKYFAYEYSHDRLSTQKCGHDKFCFIVTERVRPCSWNV